MATFVGVVGAAGGVADVGEGLEVMPPGAVLGVQPGPAVRAWPHEPVR